MTFIALIIIGVVVYIVYKIYKRSCEIARIEEQAAEEAYKKEVEKRKEKEQKETFERDKRRLYQAYLNSEATKEIISLLFDSEEGLPYRVRVEFEEIIAQFKSGRIKSFNLVAHGLPKFQPYSEYFVNGNLDCELKINMPFLFAEALNTNLNNQYNVKNVGDNRYKTVTYRDENFYHHSFNLSYVEMELKSTREF